MDSITLIQRDFLPADPLLQEAVKAGLLVFKAPDGGVCVVGQALFQGSWHGVVQQVSWASLYLGALLHAADVWRTACHLGPLIIAIDISWYKLYMKM